MTNDSARGGLSPINIRIYSTRSSTKNPHQCGFFWIEIRSLAFGRIKPTLLNHPKHIAHILNHNPGDVGDGVDVVFGVVGEAGAGHEVEVFEDGVEAFADAVVEFAQWSVVVDEQDGVFGGELGHWGEAAGRLLSCHGVNPKKRRIATGLLRNKVVAAVRGFADRRIYTKTRQTRRSPTHNRHITRCSWSRLHHA